MTKYTNKGIHYIQFFKQIHTLLKPEYYLEIGSATGQSLDVAKCDSIAIDPRFRLEGNPVGERTKTFLFQQTSDSFFRNEDVRNYFPHVDIAFLDGLHLFEFILRDFINIEKYLKKNSVVFIHDGIPLNETMAMRAITPEIARQVENTEYAKWWTGDVWKIFYALKKYRPNLQIMAVDCPPTGLLAITNFEPESTLLSDQYFEIVKEFMNIDQVENWHDRLIEDLDIKSAKDICNYPDIFKHFWL